MAHSFEESFVRNCAATLAGHKCGSLFSYHKGEGENVSEALGAVEKMIEGKGVRVRLLRECEKGALIYVYRPAMLEKRLARGEGKGRVWCTVHAKALPVQQFFKALRYRNLKPAEQENGTVPRDEVVFEHTLG